MSTQTKTRPDVIDMPDQLIEVDVQPSAPRQQPAPRRLRLTSTGAYFLALFVFVAAVVTWAMTGDAGQSEPATSDSLLHQSIRAREHAQQSQPAQTRSGQTVRAIEQAESQGQSQPANPGLTVRAIEQAESLSTQQADGGSFSDKKLQAHAKSQADDGPRPGQSIRALEHTAGQNTSPLGQVGTCDPVSGEFTPC
ncbi:MAG TPA: hypothetical protein VML96_13395 [Egibacteraceae bacterium]|nr:hypothetical protein [Egibacteraceae bacterium]